MPLEISEIGVRLAVGAPTGAAVPQPKGEMAAAPLSAQQRDDLVRACVREVLEILRMIESR
jgi:hypothetical protein